MTTDRTPVDHAELADHLTGAAHRISGILTSEYATPTGRPYLRPVLGALSAGPRVVAELTDRLEALVAEPLPVSSGGLFTLASYASALGWLTESLVELTTTVDLIPSLIESVTQAVVGGAEEAADADGAGDLFKDFDVFFTDDEWDTVSEAADAAGLTVEGYVAATGLAHNAAVTFAADCAEITAGLRQDAAYVATAPSLDYAATGEGPGSLPTLVRSLLTRMEMEDVQ